MNNKIQQCNHVHGIGFVGRARALAGKSWRTATIAMMTLLPVTAAWAAVSVTSIDTPTNIGLQMPFQADIYWSRSGAGGNEITVTLPSQLEVAAGTLPSGCTVNGQQLKCPTSTASGGTLSLQLVSNAVGGYNFNAEGTTGTAITKPLTIQRSGDLTVAKSKISPAAGVIAGEAMEFLLSPKIEAGASGVAGSDVPAGSSIVVTDTLPPGFTGVTQTFAGRTPACSQSGQVLTCTYSGAFTVAQFNASTITVKGKQGAGNGGFTNTASIAVGAGGYMERDNTNNSDAVDYQVTPGSDIAGTVSFPAGPHAVGDAGDKTLTITYTNNGPMVSNGGTVQTVIPATFDFDPATDLVGAPGCTAVAGGSLQVPAGGTPYSGWVVTCSVSGAVAVGGMQNFPITLRLPAAAQSGNFPVLATQPADLADANLSNNHAVAPFSVLPPFSNLALTKTKDPSSGPRAPGTVITNTLTITNSNSSSSALTYVSPANPLRVVDYLVPQEVDTAYGTGGVTVITAGWTCAVVTGVTPPDGVNASRTTRISCQTTNTSAQTLAKGGDVTLKFSTRIASMVANATPVELINEACTGKAALDALGLPQTAGPLPVSNTGETRAATCKSAGTGLVATPTGATADTARVMLVKQSSLTGNRSVAGDWFDPVAAAPELVEGANRIYWRVLITTPSLADNPGQQIIRTLKLADTLPGILNNNLGNTTPLIPISVWRGPTNGSLNPVAAGTINNNCPASIAAGTNPGDLCTFSDVSPGETIEVILDVSRPLNAGVAQADGTYRLTNTATLTSPDALLQGTTTDNAAVDLQPRLDVELTSKEIDVPTPAIGQPIKFTLAARNLGPFPVPANAFVIEDTLYTGNATTSQHAYEILGVSSVTPNMVCNQTVTGNETKIRCVNSAGAVASGDTETINITARFKKPSLDPVANPKGSILYTGVTNTANVSLEPSAGLCEYRTNGGAQNSSACRDANSTSNNSKQITFNVTVPKIDLAQSKQRVDASGNPVAGGTPFKLGQTARYRFKVENHGPSRAESVEMTDVLVPLPVNFDFTLAAVTPVSGKTATCSQPGGANGNILCHFGATSKADSHFEAGDQSTFIVDLTVLDKRPASDAGPVLFGNAALVCGDESATYEVAGICSSDPTLAGNNLESLQHLIMPVADLGVSKATVTSGPVDVGQPVQYRMVVDNKGANATNRIRLVDTLPAGFEWLNSGAYLPTASVSAAGASLAEALDVSYTVPAQGKGNVCYISSGPATVAARDDQQTVTCDLQGAFPMADGVVTLNLWAWAKPGVYDGTAPAVFAAARINEVAVQPGLDADGNPSALDENPANDNATSPVVVKVAASIGGRVFFDSNADGDQDPAGGDIAINNVTITLSGTDINGNVVSLTTKTNAAGDYSFVGVPPSSAAGYTITQNQTDVPPTYVNGLPQPNTPRPIRNASSSGVTAAGGTYTASNTATSSVIGGVVLANGAAGVQFDFPEDDQRSLSGRVYIDTNNNHTYDAGETGINGATIELWVAEAGGPRLVATTTTSQVGGENGWYSFTGLSPTATYFLREPLPTTPAGLFNQPSAINPGLIGSVQCPIATCGTATSAGGVTNQDEITGIKLLAGNGTQFNFGENLKTVIAGTVYLDRNDDGSNNAGTPTADPGIPGVLITIVGSGPDGVFGGADDVTWTFTTVDGTYTYEDAIVGWDYTITQTQPAGLKSGKENTSNAITVNDLPTAGSNNNNFGEVAGSLSGVVYLDRNNNGIQDAGEPGLDGVEVQLPAGTVDALGNPVATATTSGGGKYEFKDLPAGTYTVTQQAAQPVYNGTTTANGKTTAGTTTGTVTPVATTPSAISGITLAAGGVSEKNNFGEVLQVSIAGAVFLDINNDGAMVGTGETGLEGVVIELTGVDDTGATVSLSTTTDKDGKFSFDGLRPGTYTLTEPTQPAGTANGITTAGNIAGTSTGTATPVTTVPSKIADIDLSVPGSASVDNLFGEIPRSSGITGKVWEDTNNDGVIDPSEKGIGGVTVELEGTAVDGTPIKVTVTTDPDGNYSFTDLPPGTYTVTEPTQPPGTLDGKTVPGTTGGTPTSPGTPSSKISTITLGVNETSKDNNFGEIPIGSISGFVYNDSNDDGIKQGDEGGYANITVVLTGTDDLGNPVNVTVTTGADGSYTFKDLRPGTYVVTEPDQPAETLNGLTTAGTIDGASNNASVTDKATAPSAITSIVLNPGDDSVDNNFGEIGDSPDMLVSKSSSTVKFTVNNVATYTIRVRNGGQKPSFGEYIVKDRLPVGLSLAEVPAGNGWTCSGAVGDARFECRSSEVVNAGATSLSDITVKANVSAEAAKAGTVNNAVLIEGGGENEFRTPTTTERGTFEGDVSNLPVCEAGITQNVCRVPNAVQLSSSLGGTVWFDIGSDDVLLDGGDERLLSWIVELLDPATGIVSQTTATAADGSYRFGDVIPGVKWNVQFRDPASGVLWAWPVNQEFAGGMGVACDSAQAIADAGVSACRISENGSSQLQVVLKPGDHLPQQSLPVKPSGVVYDATTRDPVPGSIVTLTPVGVCSGYDPRTAVLNAGAGGYTVEGNAISMTVGSNGYYQFAFGPAAPARCEFQLTVTPPGGYQFVSSMIPPQGGALSPPGAVGSSHAVQPQANAPTGAVGTATQYWLTLFAGSATAGIVHNHLPLDTAEATGLVITKTGDRQTAEIGDTVQYTITVRQTAGSALATVNIVDTLPRGFTYIDGTGRVGGRAVEDPLGKPGPRLGFDLGSIDVGQQLVLTYRVRVGVGAQQGDGVNRAQAHGCSIAGGCIDPVNLSPVPGSIPSNRAEYRVRVTGGVFTEEACVLGKVFVDCNNNHVQDSEELGIPGVRLYFSNGTWMISDSEGKYSYCGLPPQSHTLKVDASTLPVGSRLTTSSNRNLGDADSLFLDLKNGELHRADFVEGSCSNPLLEQVKARRTQGEVRAPETEAGQSPLRFESKPVRAPQQATDSANQRPIVHPRPNPPSASASQEVQP